MVGFILLAGGWASSFDSIAASDESCVTSFASSFISTLASCSDLHFDLDSGAHIDLYHELLIYP